MYSIVMCSTVTYKEPSIYKFIGWSSDLIPPLVAAGVAKPWPSRALKHDNSAVYSPLSVQLHKLCTAHCKLLTLPTMHAVNSTQCTV